MTETSISIARVLALKVPVAWHEAVAIALQSAEQIAAANVAAGLDTCTISSEGIVEATSSRVPFAGDPLFALVAALVDRTDAPKELGALLARVEADPAMQGAPLASELAYFGRPDAAAAIRAVALRALAREAEAETHAQLEQLRADATGVPSPERTSSTRRFPVRRALIAAGGVGTLVAAGAVLALRPSVAASALPDRAPIAAVTQTIDQLIDKGLETMGLIPSTDRLSLAPTPAPAPVPPRRPRARLTAAAVSVERTLTPFAEQNRSQWTTGAASIRMVLADDAEPSPEDAEDEEIVSDGMEIYSVADQEVSPPVITRAQLRSDVAPPPTTSASPYLDVLVNEEGTVDRVRLQPRNSSVHDRMLVSAAKTWQFTPALKNGQPVKYVLRIPMPPEEGQ